MSRAATIQRISATYAIVAFILYFAVVGGCRWIKFESTPSTSSDTIRLEFGPWTYRSWVLAASGGELFVFETCHMYPDYVQIDWSWRASRAFSGLTFAFALMFVFFSILLLCISNPQTYVTTALKLRGPIFLALCIFQGLSLLIINSSLCKDNALVKALGDPDSLANGIEFQGKCSISTGAKCIISSTVFFFLASVFAGAMSRADRFERKVDAPTAGDSLDEPLNP